MHHLRRFLILSWVELVTNPYRVSVGIRGLKHWTWCCWNYVHFVVYATSSGVAAELFYWRWYCWAYSNAAVFASGAIMVGLGEDLADLLWLLGLCLERHKVSVMPYKWSRLGLINNKVDFFTFVEFRTLLVGLHLLFLRLVLHVFKVEIVIYCHLDFLLGQKLFELKLHHQLFVHQVSDAVLLVEFDNWIALRLVLVLLRHMTDCAKLSKTLVKCARAVLEIFHHILKGTVILNHRFNL